MLGSVEESLAMGAGVAHISLQVGKDERSHEASFPAHASPGRRLAHPGGSTDEQRRSLDGSLATAGAEFLDQTRDPQK